MHGLQRHKNDNADPMQLDMGVNKLVDRLNKMKQVLQDGKVIHSDKLADKMLGDKSNFE